MAGSGQMAVILQPDIDLFGQVGLENLLFNVLVLALRAHDAGHAAAVVLGGA